MPTPRGHPTRRRSAATFPLGRCFEIVRARDAIRSTAAGEANLCAPRAAEADYNFEQVTQYARWAPANRALGNSGIGAVLLARCQQQRLRRRSRTCFAH